MQPARRRSPGAGDPPDAGRSAGPPDLALRHTQCVRSPNLLVGIGGVALTLARCHDLSVGPSAADPFLGALMTGSLDASTEGTV